MLCLGCLRLASPSQSPLCPPLLLKKISNWAWVLYFLPRNSALIRASAEFFQPPPGQAVPKAASNSEGKKWAGSDCKQNFPFSRKGEFSDLLFSALLSFLHPSGRCHWVRAGLHFYSFLSPWWSLVHFLFMTTWSGPYLRSWPTPQWWSQTPNHPPLSMDGPWGFEKLTLSEFYSSQ